MAKKPAGLIYGVDEKPPLSTLLLLGLQHVSVMSVGWIFVVVIVTGIGGPQQEVTNVLRMSMIASGIATILQSLPNGPVGSGYFCPISIATRTESGEVEIRLSSRERTDPAAFGTRRLDLYNRTLGWLGGSLECIQHEGNADFIVRLPPLESV